MATNTTLTTRQQALWEKRYGAVPAHLFPKEPTVKEPSGTEDERRLNRLGGGLEAKADTLWAQQEGLLPGKETIPKMDVSSVAARMENARATGGQTTPSDSLAYHKNFGQPFYPYTPKEKLDVAAKTATTAKAAKATAKQATKARDTEYRADKTALIKDLSEIKTKFEGKDVTVYDKTYLKNLIWKFENDKELGLEEIRFLQGNVDPVTPEESDSPEKEIKKYHAKNYQYMRGKILEFLEKYPDKLRNSEKNKQSVTTKTRKTIPGL